MCASNPTALPAVALLCAALVWTNPGAAQEPLTAHLADGRTVTGTVDDRTDDDYLWLRQSTDQFDLVSGYAWTQVSDGSVAGRELRRSELRAWTSAHKQFGRTFSDMMPSRPNQAQWAGENTPRAPVLPHAPVPTTHGSSVQTLVVDAQLAQWDKDAQTDGLRVFVATLDREGNLVPVDGHIELTLVVEREYSQRGQSYRPGPEFVESDRRTFPVRKEHFHAGEAQFQLPFSRWHPDFETTLEQQALLHARLSVPGQGVFEATDARVCLREPSRFRDQLQLYSSGRYLPLERPSRDGR